MATVVILGAGLGGIPAAYEVRSKLDSSHKVIVVGSGKFYEFTPSNPWVAVGWRTLEDTRVEMHRPFERKGIEFIPEWCTAIDAPNRKLTLKGGRVLEYDYLVIATGPKLAFEEVPGLGPHGGFTQSVCKTGHAADSRADFDKLVENPGPVIVGAAAGASCFGPAYEYAFILDTELKKRKVRDKVPMHFVTPEPYAGHLGLDGVGDTKGLMESELRERHIRWTCNAKITSVEDGKMHFTEFDEDGNEKKKHELPFVHSMILPAFKGVDAVMDIDGLTNPRGFILIDEHQRNPTFSNIYAVGVCVAIPPVGPTPVPTGAPKTGYMIESMVTATTHNISNELSGKAPDKHPTWNAVCLADFGDTGVAFVALPQIPPRNTNWSGSGKWVHWAKIGFEKYYLRKIKQGKVEPFFERYAMRLMGVQKLKSKM